MDTLIIITKQLKPIFYIRIHYLYCIFYGVLQMCDMCPSFLYHIEQYHFIQNLFCFTYSFISLSKPQIFQNQRSFFWLIILSFLLLLSNVILSFLHVFSWLDTSFFSLNNISSYYSGNDTDDLSMRLLKNIMLNSYSCQL